MFPIFRMSDKAADVVNNLTVLQKKTFKIHLYYAGKCIGPQTSDSKVVRHVTSPDVI